MKAKLKRIPIRKNTKIFVREYLKAKGFEHDDSYDMVMHIVGNMLQPDIDDASEDAFTVSVPLPHDWLHEHVSESSWEGMVKAGILNFTPHVAPIAGKTGACREFRVSDSLLDQILNVDVYEMGNNHLVSSIGKDDVRGYKATSSIYDENRNRLPTIVINGIMPIEPMPFNVHAAIDYISGIDKRSSDYFHADKMLKHQVEGFHLPAYSTNPEDGYSSTVYFAGYEAKKTGRIYEHFGLQGASRVMRSIVLSGVPHIYNHDMRASQGLGLLHQFNLAGIECQFLQDYCFDAEYQKRIMGPIPKPMWKTLFYTFLFGGNVLPKLADMRYFDQLNQKETYLSAAKAVAKYARENSLTAEQVDFFLGYFCKAIEPLKKALSAWKTYLVTDFLKKPKIVVGKSTRFITNACGMKLRIDELEKVQGKAKLKSAISAHLLQGAEAATIHHLTALSSTYGFKVYSNQHDGLITNTPVSKEAFDHAKRLSGLALAELEIKPLF